MSGGQLAVYSRGGFAEEGRQRRRRRGGEERKGKEKDGRTLRNLTTPHRVVGNHRIIKLEKIQKYKRCKII